MSYKLSAERVEEIFFACRFMAHEPARGEMVCPQGVMLFPIFDSKKLEAHRSEIEGLLNELPVAFKRSSGNGESILESCLDKYGKLWTSFHLHREELFLLGMAIGKVWCPVPRDLWHFLPERMPYYVID